MADYVDDTLRRSHPVSWSAVFAGALLALTAQFLLNLLGLGIGMAAMPPPASVEGGDAAAAAGTALGWWAVSGIIAALLGGMAAGAISKRAGLLNPLMHGLLAWAVGTLAVVAALAFGGGAASATAGPLGAQMADYQMLREEAGRSPAASPQTNTTGPAAVTDSDMQQRAEAAADAIATGALVSLAALAIGALASIFGARWASGRSRASAVPTREVDVGRRTDLNAPLGSDGPGAPPRTTDDGRRPYQDRH